MVSWVLKLLLVQQEELFVPGIWKHTFLSPALGSFNCLYCCTCSAQERLDESLTILKAQVDLKLSEDVSISEEGKY